MGTLRADPRERAASGLLSAALTAGLGWALAAGLGVSLPRAAEETLAAFDVTPPPPPREERSVPPRVRSKRPEGRAAPPNIRSKATQVVAPTPIVPLPVPPLITVAPVVHVGSDPTAGAADRPGPGTGAGGLGDGFGGGGEGDGDGGGWEEGEHTPPRRKRGRISYGDFPEWAAEAAAGRPVSVRYFVNTDGRPSGCEVVRSSGSAELDRITCALIEKRFRYEPSRDGRGRPVRSVVTGDHSWEMIREPAAPDAR